MDAVLFDMDGVLVNSERYWEQFWTETVFPRTETGDPTLEEVTGRNFRENVAYLDEEYGLPGNQQRFEAIAEQFGEDIYGEKASITDGFCPLLSTLRDADLSVGIVSSSPQSWIRAVVEQSTLGPFDTLTSAEEIPGAGKPEPHVYRSAAERLDTNAGSCLVVEDSVSGVKSAHRAGATVIRYCCDRRVDPLPEADALAPDVEALTNEIFRRCALE